MSTPWSARPSWLAGGHSWGACRQAQRAFGCQPDSEGLCRRHIISPVRRYLLLLMIVFLPLRAWAGDSMAIEMATTALFAGHAEASAMPPACPMHAEVSAPADAGETGMEACSSCDLCLPIAETTEPSMQVVAFANHVKRALRDAASLSAPPAPSFKPPIS